MTLQQDVPKVSLYNLGYRCFILSRMVLFSTLYANGIISYGRIRVILIAIGMHTKPCIASLAFTACNAIET